MPCCSTPARRRAMADPLAHGTARARAGRHQGDPDDPRPSRSRRQSGLGQGLERRADLRASAGATAYRRHLSVCGRKHLVRTIWSMPAARCCGSAGRPPSTCRSRTATSCRSGAGLRVVHLPGHTLGHCGFYSRAHDLLFSGDLFASYFFNVHLPTRILNSAPELIPAEPREGAASRSAPDGAAALRHSRRRAASPPLRPAAGETGRRG